MSGSILTKRAFEQSIINLCRNTRFEKISIYDIANNVGLNRQTFYYHFTDKYDLLAFTYYDQAFHILDDDTVTVENWEEKALECLEVIQHERGFYRNTVEANSRILMKGFSQIVHDRFMDLFAKIDIQNKTVLSDREFYARFWGYGCSGLLLDWIINDYHQSPDEVASSLFKMAKDTEFYALLLYEN